MSYDICLFLSNLLHLVWLSLGPSMLLQMALFHSLYGWVIFHCIYVHLLYPFLFNGHLGCFHVLTIVNSPAVNIRVEIVTDFIFLGSKITADSDCSHEIKRCLLLERKALTNLDSILISGDITLLTKVHIVKAMVFQ